MYRGCPDHLDCHCWPFIVYERIPVPARMNVFHPDRLVCHFSVWGRGEGGAEQCGAKSGLCFSLWYCLAANNCLIRGFLHFIFPCVFRVRFPSGVHCPFFGVLCLADADHGCQFLPGSPRALTTCAIPVHADEAQPACGCISFVCANHLPCCHAIVVSFLNFVPQGLRQTRGKPGKLYFSQQNEELLVEDL